MTRGEVYWADLVPRSGSEQQGRRPVIVISHDAFNQTQNWRSIIVVPLSTSGGASRARAFCCVAATRRSRSRQRQCCALSPSDHSGSLEAYPTNWRIEFNGAEEGRRWSQGRDGLAVGVR